MFDNGVAAAMSSKTIRINASAVQAELQLSQAGQETVFAFLGGSSVDSLATPATYTIDWGDGTAQAPDIQVLYATGAALPADPSHTFTRARPEIAAARPITLAPLGSNVTGVNWPDGACLGRILGYRP